MKTLPGLLMAILGLFAGSTGQSAAAAEPPASPRAEVSLKDRLVTGLRAVRPDDVAFCEQVAEATQTGRLPAKLVDRTYFWAISRGNDYPLPSFAKALDIQCRRLGIAWP